MVTETHSAKWSDRWNLISTISGVVATPRFASQTACAPGSGGEQLPRGLLPQPLLHAAVQLGKPPFYRRFGVTHSPFFLCSPVRLECDLVLTTP